MKIKSPLVVGTAVNRSLATSCSPPPAIACLHLWSLASTCYRQSDSPPSTCGRSPAVSSLHLPSLPSLPSTCHCVPLPAIACHHSLAFICDRSPSLASNCNLWPPLEPAIASLHQRSLTCTCPVQIAIVSIAGNERILLGAGIVPIAGIDRPPGVGHPSPGGSTRAIRVDCCQGLTLSRTESCDGCLLIYSTVKAAATGAY